MAQCVAILWPGKTGLREGPQQEAGKWFRRPALQDPGPHRPGKGRPQRAQVVGGVDPPPLLPAQDTRPVDQEEPARGCLGADGEVFGDAELKTLPGTVSPSRSGSHPLGEASLGGLEGGSEEVALVTEVVIERTRGDARLTHHRLSGDLVKATLAEKLCGGGDQSGARRFRPFALASSRHKRTLSMYVSSFAR